MGKYLLVACLCACGRYGFSDSAPDAAPTVDAGPDAAPAKLACGTPTRFQVGATGISTMAMAAPAWGFGLFTVDSSNIMHAWVYSFSGTDLVAMVQNTTMATSMTGVLGAATLGDNILVASASGVPTATASVVYAMDSKGEEVAQPVSRAALAVTTPLAESGSSTGVALATMPSGSTQVDVHLLDASGSDVATPTTIIPAATGADTVKLATAGSGYAAVWGQTASSRHAIEIELFDSNLNPVAGPLVADDLANDAYNGSVVFAAQSNEYLVTWHEKNSSGGDDVWFTILGSDLSVKVLPTLVANNGHNAVAASDGTGFWMVWDVYPGAMPEHLAGAAIDPNGIVTPRAITSSGGTPHSWAMTTRDGQPVLVWTEAGGSGPDLYFDPMCSQ
jgi:hypothetical protein